MTLPRTPGTYFGLALSLAHLGHLSGHGRAGHLSLARLEKRLPKYIRLCKDIRLLVLLLTATSSKLAKLLETQNYLKVS